MNRAHFRIHWLVMKWRSEQSNSFRQIPKWVNGDRTQHVRSSSSQITIVVMILLCLPNCRLMDIANSVKLPDICLLILPFVRQCCENGVRLSARDVHCTKTVGTVVMKLDPQTGLDAMPSSPEMTSPATSGALEIWVEVGGRVYSKLVCATTVRPICKVLTVWVTQFRHF